MHPERCSVPIARCQTSNTTEFFNAKSMMPSALNCRADFLRPTACSPASSYKPAGNFLSLHHFFFTYFCGWVMFLSPRPLVFSCNGKGIVQSQVLPGIEQSIDRAEVHAILLAVQLSECCTVYSDCKYAVESARVRMKCLQESLL